MIKYSNIKEIPEKESDALKYNPDSFFYSLMTRLANMMILNILFLLNCLPIITIGSAWTSLYYVALKIFQNNENEELSVTKCYFHSFRQNFLTATGIWLLALIAGFVLILDIRIIGIIEIRSLQTALRISVGAVVLLFLITLQFVFPVLSRYQLSLLPAIKTAAMMAIGSFPIAVFLLILTAGVTWISLLNKYTIYTGIFFWMTFGFSAISMCKSGLFLRVFAKYEKE